MSYQKLEIWQMARDLTVAIHNLSFTLPKFEQFEEAQQIRRSMKSVRSNIVEGYGRRFYAGDNIRFLIYAQASNDETIDHPDILYETKSLTDEKLYIDIRSHLVTLDKKINNFLQALVRRRNQSVKAQPQYLGAQ